MQKNEIFLSKELKQGQNLFDALKQVKNLKFLFKSDSLCSLNTLGKFIKNSLPHREPGPNDRGDNHSLTCLYGQKGGGGGKG